MTQLFMMILINKKFEYCLGSNKIDTFRVVLNVKFMVKLSKAKVSHLSSLQESTEQCTDIEKSKQFIICLCSSPQPKKLISTFGI